MEEREQWAEWTDMQCAKCGAYFVAQDRYGFYCVAHKKDGTKCDWRRDYVTLQPDAPAPHGEKCA